jgi:ketosteroid isomerase-like protein
VLDKLWKRERLMSQRNCLLAVVVVVAACVTSSHSRANDHTQVNATLPLEERLVAAIEARDINGIMALYVPDESLRVFDLLPPRQYVGATEHQKNWERFLARYSGTIHAEVSDWRTETAGDLAVGYGISRIYGPGKDGKPLDVTVRLTDIFKKINGKWLVIHEHVSCPIDVASGKADLSSKPAEELAKQFGVSPTTINEWGRTGTHPLWQN